MKNHIKNNNFTCSHRSLNTKTIADLFPLPSIKMILQKLNKQKHFILIDLKDSYQSIRIKEEDRKKASIVTPQGQFSPTRMVSNLTLIHIIIRKLLK